MSDENHTVTCYVSVGDTHYGCKLGLMPPIAKLDFDTEMKQSPMQAVVYRWWREFHDEFVPWATRGEPYALCHGGDIVDGVHHRSTSQATQDMEAQESLAVADMAPLVSRAAAYFQLAGTPAHDGESWVAARRIADRLGAVQNEGSSSHLHPELRLMVGDAMIQDTHHVSGTGLHKSMPTGITSDAIEQFITAAKSGSECPQVFLRHHCHHASRSGGFLRDPNVWWNAVSVPGWQLKGPYPWKVGARNHLTHFGGVVVRWVTNPFSAGHVEILPYTRGAGPVKPIVINAAGGKP